MPKRTSVGLDIGSSAVRAAEVLIDGKKSALRRFGQVGLPPGAVVEGEVRDAQAVTAAIKRLWADTGFKARDVVVGISSQRAMVRVLDMPGTLGRDLRSALRYEIGDLLPIPVEQAVFDFETLGPGRPSGDGAATTQVLVVVAQKDIVWDEINVVRKAGLRPRAVDASALALLRAVPARTDGEAMDAVVSLGAQLAVVAVRQGGLPRFIRTAALGSETEAPVRSNVVARVAQGPGKERPDGQSAPARTETAVEEVRSSIEYFLSHGRGGRLERLSLTGGAALGAGLKERLSTVLETPVAYADLVADVDGKVLGLSPDQVGEAGARWTAAVGLALWGTEGAQSPNLLPREIAERSRQRQTVALAAAGVVVVAAGLGVVSYQKTASINSVNQQAAAAQQQVGALQTKIDRLAYVTRAASDLQARRSLAVSALQGDVDWVGLQHRIARALPAGVKVTALNLTASAPTPPAAGAPPAAPGTQAVVGSITMSCETRGGLGSVAAFVKAMTRVSGLGAVWVANNQMTPGGADNFSVTGQVTSAALSKRAALLPGGTK